MKRRCLLPAAVISVLYALNRFCLIPLTGSRLLAWYGADFLGGALMLCVLDALLIVARRPPIRRPLPVSLFLLGCGLFWECITPLYLARSVPDPWDILAVWLGGMAMLLIQRHILQ